MKKRLKKHLQNQKGLLSLIYQTQKAMNYLETYKTEINDVARYAKRIGFDFATGSFDELMKGWLEDGRKFQVAVQDNKEEVLRKLKTKL